MFFLAGVLAGCVNTEMQKRTQRRVENIHDTMDSLAGIEAGRGGKLGRTLDMFERQYQRDLVRSSENPRKVNDLLQADFDDWEKQQPVICRHIVKMFAGHPEKIDKSVFEILD
jgi:hypothetical protein